eukprot:gene11126-13605_t
MMSAPYGGPRAWPMGEQSAPEGLAGLASPELHAALAKLDPPRRHYQWFYSTREADADMHHAPQGLHAFLRAYYHHKSADWAANKPYPLGSFTAEALAVMPTYYIMPAGIGMAETVAAEMPDAATIAANTARSVAGPASKSPGRFPFTSASQHRVRRPARDQAQAAGVRFRASQALRHALGQVNRAAPGIRQRPHRR